MSRHQKEWWVAALAGRCIPPGNATRSRRLRNAGRPTHLEKRSAMALFFPRPLSESSLAVTRRDCVAQDCRVNGPLSISASCWRTWKHADHSVRWSKAPAAVTPALSLTADFKWLVDLQTHGSGKPQFFPTTLSQGVLFVSFHFVCFYNLAKWHQTHSTGWLQICACTVLHKCNLFKLALHAQPLDCWVEAQLQAHAEHVVIMKYHTEVKGHARKKIQITF